MALFFSWRRLAIRAPQAHPAFYISELIRNLTIPLLAPMSFQPLHLADSPLFLMVVLIKAALLIVAVTVYFSLRKFKLSPTTMHF